VPSAFITWTSRSAATSEKIVNAIKLILEETVVGQGLYALAGPPASK
jgi:hypothetical protein